MTSSLNLSPKLGLSRLLRVFRADDGISSSLLEPFSGVNPSIRLSNIAVAVDSSSILAFDTFPPLRGVVSGLNRPPLLFRGSRGENLLNLIADDTSLLFILGDKSDLFGDSVRVGVVRGNNEVAVGVRFGVLSLKRVDVSW